MFMAWWFKLDSTGRCADYVYPASVLDYVCFHDQVLTACEDDGSAYSIQLRFQSDWQGIEKTSWLVVTVKFPQPFLSMLLVI